MRRKYILDPLKFETKNEKIQTQKKLKKDKKKRKKKKRQKKQVFIELAVFPLTFI